MSMFKGVLSFVVVLTSLGFLCLLSCERDASNKSATKDTTEDIVSAEKRSPGFKVYYLNGEERFIRYNLPKGDLKNRPKEEEIKYFLPTGSYDLRISALSSSSSSSSSSSVDAYETGYDRTESYSYVYPEDLEGQNVIDPKGNILSELDKKQLFEKVVFYGDLFYKTKIDPNKYNIIDEWYTLGAVESMFYCKEVQLEVFPEDIILDDNFRVRLYDKNDEVIDEYKMRNTMHLETYKKNPERYQKKITARGVSSASLIGVLKLPPKDQREGLKYRVLRLDKKGQPKPYLYEGADKYPYQYYLREETLPPYLEYKYWRYSKETGCYSLVLYPEPQFNFHD